MRSVNTTLVPREVRIPVGDTWLYGDLVLPPGFHGLVLFAHGSGSGCHSARNRQVAQYLQHAGIATLLFDLLTPQPGRAAPLDIFVVRKRRFASSIPCT